MKLIYKVFMLAGILPLSSCERDDICAEDSSTTPRLLIEFFDVLDQDNLKNVPNLTVYGEGLTESPEVSNNKTLIFNSSENAVALPLIIGNEGEEVTTRFVMERRTDFRLDGDAGTSSNIDIVEITYIPEFEFVSRACGYKSVFTDLKVRIVPDGDNWIIASSFPNNLNNTNNITVANEDATHVNLLH